MSYTSIEAVEGVASPSPFSCPSCGGVLWNVNHGNQVHSFRCHAGHAFSQEGLLDFKSREVEETLWASLRLLEEHKRILVNFTKAGQGTPSHDKRIEENQRYINIFRGLLLADRAEGTGPAQP